jgi:iron complex outermembrane recepter protein
VANSKSIFPRWQIGCGAKSRQETKRLLVVAAAVLATAASHTTRAQTATPTEGAALAEIVVTAEKRSERAQDIPVTVSTLSGEQLTSGKIRNMDDLSAAVPSLEFISGLNGSTYIRGVGAPITTAGNQPDVAMYVDGILLVSPLQATGAFNNVERVEILEGPQGTLFGRNASGGVINIVTADPSQKASSSFSIGYGNYQTTEVKFYANVPITSTLAANVAGYFYDQGQGWGTNITTGQDSYREWSNDVRVKLGWTPDDRTEVILTYDHSYVHSELTNGRILQGTMGVGGTPAPAGWYDTSNDYPSYNNTGVDSGSVRASFDFGAATFRSITAYTAVSTFWPYDSDQGPLAVIQGPIYDDASGFTQELQLISPNNQKVIWAVGFYYLNNQAAFKPIDLFGSEFGTAVIDVYGHTTTQSYAAYGQESWEFLPSTHLTLGARYTIDYASIDGHTDVNKVMGTEHYQDTTFKDPSWRVGLDHRFSPELMAYATFSTGFNAGQYNTGNAAAPPVQPEKLTAYEVGIKSNWLEGRLQANVSAYWYDFKNLQVSVVENAVTVQSNAAAANIKGVELSLEAQPVSNLHLQAGFAYTDAKYTDYTNVQFYVPLPGGGYTTVVGDATGNSLTAFPKIGASASADYEIHSSVGLFTTSINYGYKGKIYWNYSNTIATDPYSLLGAQIKFQPSKADNWFVTLWGKNLTDTQYNQTEGVRLELASAVPGPPRTFGIAVGAHF